MTHEANKISDADLHAYVDGQLDQNKQQEIERFLAENSDKANEVAGWQRQNETLQALYNNVADEPLPNRLNPHTIAQKQVKQWRNIQSIAAMIALFVLGSVAGWFSNEIVSEKQTIVAERPMVQRALLAHAVYSVEVQHPVEVRADNEQHLVSWLSKRLKTPLKAPKLKSKGFSLIGGRLLPGDEEVAAQFMYEDNQGRRISLYLIRNQKQQASSFRYASFKGMSAFYWHDDQVSYALVGNVSRDRLSVLSHEVYNQLTRYMT
jgi:anti-sigma factor RsiW